MKLTKLFLGTSALIGAGILVGGLSLPAAAAEVKPGGALDVTISGFARFRAHGGDVDNARLDNDFSKGLDFSNDTEVHAILRGKDEKTGIEYGGTVEFEADTNRTDNTDESWVFVRGGFGEVRFGDEDGVTDNSSVGAQTIAAGTGGIDGSVIDVIGTSVVYLTNSDDATKIRYYTPSFGGFSVGLSYTPNQDTVFSGGGNGDSLATKDVEVEDLFEGGLVYDGEFGNVGLLASLVGSYGDLKVGDNDDFRGIQGGAAVTISGFKIAGSYATEEIGDAEKSFFTAGVGYGYGPFNVSVTYGQVVDSDNLIVEGDAPDTDADDNTLDKPRNLVFSADYALMPGLVLAGDVGFFDNDVDAGPNEGDDDGWQAVARLGLAF